LGGGPTRERGRPARMHCRGEPLSFLGCSTRPPCRPKRHRLGRSRVPRGGPTRERGRPARMHTRRVPLSFPAIRRPATLPAGTAWARPKQRLGVHPGTRASRPHALPWRATQFPRDSAPGHPAGGNAMGSAEVEYWRLCRSNCVEREDGRRLASVVRAGRPRSRVASSRQGAACQWA